MLQSSPTSQPRRLSQRGLIDRSRPLLFRFNGQPYQGYAGDTLASALMANDVLLVARSPRLHRPRGLVAAGADDPNAFVACNGQRELATTTPLYDGLAAHSLNHWPSLGFDLLAAAPYLPSALNDTLDKLTSGEPVRAAASDRGFAFCDVLVVGGGALGLMAALAAGRSKARVILVDDDVRLGGRLNSDRHTVDRMPGVDWVADITAELATLTNVRIILRGTLMSQAGETSQAYTVVERLTDQPPGLSTGSPDQPTHRRWSITAKQCIGATGYRERPLVFANNDRPGVMLAGSLRTYLNRYAVAPGERVILYATHDEAATTIADITRAGAIVEAVIDPRRTPSEAVAAAAERVGAEVVAGAVSRALGSRHVEGIEVQTLSGNSRVFECDLVAMSDGWSPAWPLAPGPQRVTPKTARLADCLAAGVAAGLAAAAQVGFPDALIDPPDTDEDGHSAAVADWPDLAPLRGLASRNWMQGPAFVDFAADTVAQAAAYPTGARPNDSAELVTFAAVDPPVAALVPPPAAPFRRLATGDVFGAAGTMKRFSRAGLVGNTGGVRATLHAHVALAQLVAKPKQSAALATRIAERIGITLPPPGRRLVAGHLSFLATQPGMWLASADDEDGALFAGQLAIDLGAFADIADLTSEVALVDIGGSRCRALLALGLELDTDPRVFPAGHCASAALGHMMTTVSCIASGTAFQVIIGHNDMPDFANWLAASGTEFGLETLA
jgi:heterotetrameric sarcosine oxidase gamma subunit